MKPGDVAEIEVNRDGDQKTFRIKLGGWENNESPLAKNENASEAIGDRLMGELGITLSNLTPDLARDAGFEEEAIDGVIVMDIDPTSYAAREANLHRGAVISEIDRKKVGNLKEFEAVYENIEAGKAFIKPPNLSLIHISEPTRPY